MNTMLLMMSVIILLCIMLNIISSKIGVPVLLAFILLGMVFGSDGIFKIKFDDFKQAETICSFALIFIMFYGGFGTTEGGTAFKRRSTFDFGICGIIRTLYSKVFMDKHYAYRSCYLLHRCCKCVFNTP